MTIDQLYQLFRRHNHYDGVEATKSVLQGTAAPGFRPLHVGMIYCDTTNAKVYISTGTSTSSDWKILN